MTRASRAVSIRKALCRLYPLRVRRSAGVAEALNALLASGGAGRGFDVRFVLEDTVRYTPAGSKLKALEDIIASKGFALVR